MPQTFPGCRWAISPDYLAGLACEEEVVSRLVRGRGQNLEVRQGPLDRETFAGLPERDWTLLVQDVDRLIPEVGELLEAFRFVPNWRIDDVMVSYAAPGGGVGAHVDRYDVFLIQALGRRRWRIESRARDEPLYVEGLDLQILERFEPDEEWVLEPGDVLYLPPGIPHEGVAMDPCMTFSVGFRAPEPRDLLAGWLQDRLARPRAGDDRPISFPQTAIPAEPGEIDGETLAEVAAVVRQAAELEPEELAGWFGRLVTERRRAEIEDGEADIEAGTPLRRVKLQELAFVRRGDGGAMLFACGESFDLDADEAWFAERVTGTGALDGETLARAWNDPRLAGILRRLVGLGVLEPLAGPDPRRA